MNVVALQADFTYFLVVPLHEQQAPVTSVALIRAHAAVHAPVDVEPRSFNPKVGSTETTSPAFANAT